MAQITNNSGISLSLAVWLVNDDYDYVGGIENYISVTTLMRPVKQIVLAQRIPPQDRVEDVEDFIARGLGNSIHDSIEKAWKNNYAKNLKKLGIPESVISRVMINPTDEELNAADKSNGPPIPVYLEQRGYRVFNGWTVGGKFDLVAEGHVEDNKSTSAYGWVYGTRDEENRLQGSLYNWIDKGRVAEGHLPRITEDYMRVNYIFTDWQKSAARQNPDYPQRRVAHKDIPLLPLDETEQYVAGKLAEIQRYWNAPEEQMPECSDEDLWRSAPQFKYYSDPEKAKDPSARSTKNFDTLFEANQFKAEKGKGVVVTKPGEVKRCGYCPAFDGCKQKDQYFNV